MLLYYHSWMFYNHFIATLYHFLGLTYWPSAQCQLLFFACFLHRRKSISNRVQTPRNFLWIFYGPEDIQWAKEAPGGVPRGGSTHQGAPGGPDAPKWVVPTLGAHWTASSPYKFPNIQKSFGVALDQKFRHRKASVSTRSNLDPVPASCRRGESSPVVIFIIPAATTMRRD